MDLILEHSDTDRLHNQPYSCLLFENKPLRFESVNDYRFKNDKIKYRVFLGSESYNDVIVEFTVRTTGTDMNLSRLSEPAVLHSALMANRMLITKLNVIVIKESTIHSSKSELRLSCRPHCWRVDEYIAHHRTMNLTKITTDAANHTFNISTPVGIITIKEVN